MRIQLWAAVDRGASPRYLALLDAKPSAASLAFIETLPVSIWRCDLGVPSMKRHKRDPSNRAWNKGYQAGFIGRSRDSCPHQALTQRESWIDGWTIGQRELAEGTLPLAGFHKRVV